MSHSRIKHTRVGQSVYWKNQYGKWVSGVVQGVSDYCISATTIPGDEYLINEHTILLLEGEFTVTNPFLYEAVICA